MTHEVSDFNTEVIEASQDRPILVDFWAPWCGPCRTLSPTLEKLASEAEGRWSLVTVNTDENPELSMSYSVRGIPAVKLFSSGEVVAEFTGAMPEHAVKQWLDQQIPSEADKSLSAVKELMRSGRMSEALNILESLQSEPEARLMLASIVVLEDPERALELAVPVAAEDSAAAATKEAVQTVANAIVGGDADDLPEGPGKVDYQSAIAHLKAGDIGGAIQALMQVLLKDRYYADDAARKLGVALFTLLGESHPVAREFRRTFDMYLY
jgi:putative thioredoxin